VDLLRQPLHAIRDAQNARLIEMLALCARGHDFYRRRWSQAAIDIAAIGTVDDLEKLPPTSKRDLMDDPEAFRLRVPGLPLHERALWNVLHTTGSTGDPTPLYVTTHDYEANLFQCRRVADIAGLRDTDVIANLFPLTPAAMGSFVRAAENAYAIGAAVVAALTGAPHGRFDVHRSLDEAVSLVDRRRATVLWGVPSFLRRVIIRAHELGADFRSVRMCALTGEATTPGMRQDLRTRLRALGVAQPIMFDRYGSTEGGALAQCREEGDWHNPAPELLYHEVIDPDTGRRLPDGERGVLAITHLDRRGTVLVRYMVGDVLAITHEQCPHCGRNGDRLVGPVVRTKDLMKVKGMLMSPDTLQEAIRLVSGVDEFQVVVTRQDPADPYSMDELVVRVATRRSDVARLTDEVVMAAATATGVRPRVEVTAANDIYDPSRDAKAQRFVDRRTT
jgi:phenylacetate-coenzyme A ligase PaaK-like adenylate-forming protein